MKTIQKIFLFAYLTFTSFCSFCMQKPTVKATNLNANANATAAAVPVQAQADVKVGQEVGSAAAVKSVDALDQKQAKETVTQRILTPAQSKVAAMLTSLLHSKFAVRGKAGRIFLPLDIVQDAIIAAGVQRDLKDVFPIASLSESNVLRTFDNINSIGNASFNHNGTKLAITFIDNSVKVFDLTLGTVLYTLLHSDRVNCVSFNNAGTLIVTASNDRTAKIWSMKNGALVYSLHHEGSVFSAEFNHDGSQIVTSAANSGTIIWNVHDGKVSHKLSPESLESHSYRASFNYNGTQIVTTSFGREATIWDARAGSIIKNLHFSREVSSAAFNFDGSKLVATEVGMRTKIFNLQDYHYFPLTGENEHSAKFNRMGTKIITTSNDKMAKIWDVQTGTLLCVLHHNSPIYYAEFNHDETTVITMESDQIAKIWDLREVKERYNGDLPADQLMFLWLLEQYTVKNEAKGKKTIKLHPDLLIELSTFPLSIQKAIVKKYNISNPPKEVVEFNAKLKAENSAIK